MSMNLATQWAGGVYWGPTLLGCTRHRTSNPICINLALMSMNLKCYNTSPFGRHFPSCGHVKGHSTVLPPKWPCWRQNLPFLKQHCQKGQQFCHQCGHVGGRICRSCANIAKKVNTFGANSAMITATLPSMRPCCQQNLPSLLQHCQKGQQFCHRCGHVGGRICRSCTNIAKKVNIFAANSAMLTATLPKRSTLLPSIHQDRETWLCSFMWQIYFQSNLKVVWLMDYLEKIS